MLKTYLAFVQNTIEPMFERAEGLIRFAESKGLPIDKETLSGLLEKGFLAHVCSEILRGVIQIIIAVIVCYTVWMIARFA